MTISLKSQMEIRLSSHSLRLHCLVVIAIVLASSFSCSLWPLHEAVCILGNLIRVGAFLAYADVYQHQSI
ncbi:hypothetical protein Ae201684_009762 [Aphanomyces euteiches]|uniref:Uncharacterized protein n=1 Tax=Aphanomyces euteiches TaxID=100861 RepID=A0A6G0X170_9STRA|nr:hypothetical protein Ae201684_009762 [Aphanomyces euteiches]